MHHKQPPRPGGTAELEAGITSRPFRDTPRLSRPLPATKFLSPPRRPVGTKPICRAARDIVTGPHNSGITSRPFRDTPRLSRPLPATKFHSPPNHDPPPRRPVGTKPNCRAARDIVTGPHNSGITSRPFRDTPRLSRPLPATNFHSPHRRPVGTKPKCRAARDIVTGLLPPLPSSRR